MKIYFPLKMNANEMNIEEKIVGTSKQNEISKQKKQSIK